MPRPKGRFQVIRVLAGIGLIATFMGCTSTPDGGQVLKLPNCQVRSSGQVSCTTSGMHIPLPK